MLVLTLVVSALVSVSCMKYFPMKASGAVPLILETGVMRLFIILSLYIIMFTCSPELVRMFTASSCVQCWTSSSFICAKSCKRAIKLLRIAKLYNCKKKQETWITILKSTIFVQNQSNDRNATEIKNMTNATRHFF